MSFLSRLARLAVLPITAPTQAVVGAAQGTGRAFGIGGDKKEPQAQPQPAGPAISEEQRQQVLAPLPQVQLGRIGGAEEQAQRAQLAKELMAQQQAGQRQLLAQQAKQGVRGGAAAAQQSRLQQQIAAQRASQEEQGFLGRQMFNLEQGQREQFSNVAGELARRQLAASLLGQEAQVQAAREFARTQAAALQNQDDGGLLSFLKL